MMLVLRVVDGEVGVEPDPDGFSTEGMLQGSNRR